MQRQREGWKGRVLDSALNSTPLKLRRFYREKHIFADIEDPILKYTIRGVRLVDMRERYVEN